MAHDILIVDDEADIRMLIAGVLKDEGYATREAADSAETLNELRARQPTLVILDIWLQDSELDGIEILRHLRSEMPSVPVVMISGHGTIETAVEAIKIGAYDFIEKPFKSDRLLLIVQRAIETALLRRENEELRLRAGGEIDLVGISVAASQLRQQIDRVAPTGSRVLISGAPGVGKEVVGRLLHAHSRRASGPFVAVNCATMHPDRLELELFGSESAVDGAPRKVGTFERAHGGTLFLDEVADMPIETQGKIVRVLQEQTFERVVGSHRVEVDVRSSPRPIAISAGKSPPASVPRGSVLSAQCRADPRAGAARAAARTSRCSRAISWSAAPTPRGCRRARWARMPWRRCRPTRGRATCASCATSSIGS